MNEQVVLLAIGVVVAAFVLRPLLRKRPSQPSARTAKAQSGTAVVPESEELAELELDREMGRVSDEDYARFRADIESRAPVSAHVPAGDAAPDDARARAEERVQRWKDAPRPACQACGLRPEPAARYCSNCGAPLA